MTGWCAEYDRLLIWVLKHQTLTLLVAVGTLVLTVLMYIAIPKGFFPLQDTGFIQAITEAGPTVSFEAMSQRQQQLADKILQDPDVASLSSFIGVDGTNNTLNSGRFLINLKPKSERDGVATVMDRLAEDAHSVPGITFYLQPVQDLTIDSVVSRAQYQFVLQAATSAVAQPVRPQAAGRAEQGRRRSATSPPPSWTRAFRPIWMVDRDTAARFGVTAATIDNALYDSFGQRIISTIFTQSNQYRVILEADPSAAEFGAVDAGHLSAHRRAAGRCRWRPSPRSSSARAAAGGSSVPVPLRHLLLRCRAGLFAGRGGGRHPGRPRPMPARPPGITTQFEGSALAFQSALSNEVLLILAAIITVYIVLGVLYESFIHPVTILSTLPSAGVGALLALIITGHDLNIVSIIGIILLIGIVKKNAIMMIDFALEAERNEGKIAGRGHPPGGAAALPPHPDDHGGGAVRRPAADAGLGHGLGAAPSAGHFHRGRPFGQPAAHPVHHPGDLYLFRQGRAATCANGARAAAPAMPDPNRSPRNELCPALHPAAASPPSCWRWGWGWRDWSPISCCRSRPIPISTFPPSR